MPLPCAVALREGFIGVFKERLSLGTIRKYNAHDQNGHIFFFTERRLDQRGLWALVEA